MTKKTESHPSIDDALLEMAQDFGGTLLSKEVAEKITMRVLARKAKAAPEITTVTPQDIRAMREGAHLSQAVLAKYLNVTPGYVARLERGATRPTGAMLTLLSVIKRKGIEAIL